MSVNLDKTTGAVASRAATYVWGPDLESRRDARGDWQPAGGVGGLLTVLHGLAAEGECCECVCEYLMPIHVRTMRTAVPTTRTSVVPTGRGGGR